MVDNYYKMKKCVFIGSFANGFKARDGQTIKTRILFEEIESKKIFGNCKIVDTYKWKNRPLRLLIDTLIGIVQSKYIIISLSKNGMRLYFPLLYLASKFFKKEVHHFVIGGDLANKVLDNKSYIKYLKSFECNYVEIEDMKKDLAKMDIKNCKVVPNFKKLKIIEAENMLLDVSEPYNLCTFSRICKEKGIEDAVKAVTEINKKMGRTCYRLTIYGIPDDDYKEIFENMQESFPSYITYGGLVNYDETSEVLKEYYLLLFPTYHDGEGFPGTLIDAFAAGLPVIASDWKYNGRIIDDKITGRLYKSRDIQSLIDLLIYYKDNPTEVINMKYKCIVKANNYTPDVALQPFYEKFKCS